MSKNNKEATPCFKKKTSGCFKWKMRFPVVKISLKLMESGESNESQVKSKASLQVFSSYRDNLVWPGYHDPLLPPVFLSFFLEAPSGPHQRKVLKMLEVNEYSSWGSRWLAVEQEAQGMRNMNGNISEINLRPWPHPVLSKWPDAEPTASLLLEQNITVLSLLTERVNLHSQCLEKIREYIFYPCSLLPLGYMTIWRLFPDLPNFLSHLFSSHTLPLWRPELRGKLKSLKLY